MGANSKVRTSPSGLNTCHLPINMFALNFMIRLRKLYYFKEIIILIYFYLPEFDYGDAT